MSKAMKTGFRQGFTPSRTSLTADEKLGSIFGSDSLLAADFFQTMRRKTHLEPETQLMIAVLEDAIECFQKHLFAQDVGTEKLFNDAAAWILDSESDWVFSFENICEHLGLDAGYMRRGLIQWLENALASDRSARGKGYRTAGAMVSKIAGGSYEARSERTQSPASRTKCA